MLLEDLQGREVVFKGQDPPHTYLIVDDNQEQKRLVVISSLDRQKFVENPSSVRAWNVWEQMDQLQIEGILENEASEAGTENAEESTEGVTEENATNDDNSDSSITDTRNVDEDTGGRNSSRQSGSSNGRVNRDNSGGSGVVNDNSDDTTAEEHSGVTDRLLTATTTAPEQPDKPLISLKFELNDEKIKEAIDGILMIRWDDVQKCHNRDEVERHLGFIPYYCGILSTAASSLEREKDGLEKMYDRWWATQEKTVLRRIQINRQAEVKSKLRNSVGTITKDDMKNGILTDKDMGHQYTLMTDKIAELDRDAKQLKSLVRFLEMKSNILQVILKSQTQQGYKGGFGK